MAQKRRKRERIDPTRRAHSTLIRIQARRSRCLTCAPTPRSSSAHVPPTTFQPPRPHRTQTAPDSWPCPPTGSHRRDSGCRVRVPATGGFTFNSTRSRPRNGVQARRGDPCHSPSLPQCYSCFCLARGRPRQKSFRSSIVDYLTEFSGIPICLSASLRRAFRSALVRHTLTSLRLVHMKLRLRGVFDEKLEEPYRVRKKHVRECAHLGSCDTTTKTAAAATSPNPPHSRRRPRRPPRRKAHLGRHASMHMQAPDVSRFNMLAATAAARNFAHQAQFQPTRFDAGGVFYVFEYRHRFLCRASEPVGGLVNAIALVCLLVVFPVRRRVRRLAPC